MPEEDEIQKDADIINNRNYKQTNRKSLRSNINDR